MKCWKIVKALGNPRGFLMKVNHRYPWLLKWMPDKTCLKFLYRIMFGKKLDLIAPKTFNEKLQWLKINDHNPEYTTMVDKYAVKKFVSDKIGAEYIVPTIGVWDRFEDIDFDALPDQFVLKCTHDSGGFVICRNKDKFNVDMARKKLKARLTNNFYYVGREWPYKNVVPRIIAEQYMGEDLRDYKMFSFEGVPRMTLVCSERFTEDGLKEDFYDEAWNHLDIQRPAHANAILPIVRPKQYKLMKELAAKLSQKIPFVRIDFYEINEKVYFGEITFYPASGFEGFRSESWDMKMGNWIKLPGGMYRLDTGDCSVVIAAPKRNKENIKFIVDYKFFCFNGIADSVMVCTERETGNPKFYFFDKNWDLKRYNIRGKEAPDGFTLPKPDCIEEMFSIAEKLSKGIPFVRVDLYCIDGLIYFGEMTFYPDSGFDVNLLPECDEQLGAMLSLPSKNGNVV